MGVAEEVRRSGLGTVLLISALKGLRELGYAYGVIGGGLVRLIFYARAVGAMPIEGSSPGIYMDILPEP